MKEAKVAVVYDLDSTLADTRHRWHLNPRADPSSDWEKYSLACPGDLPIAGTIMRMGLDYQDFQVHICTGRSEAARDLTVAWLDKYACAYDYLHMRPDRDHTPNGRFKVHYIRELSRRGIPVALFYEDWGEAAAYIAEHAHVPVLGINPFYPEDIADLEAGRELRGLKSGL
jgi:hypothetical protein